MAFDFLTNCFIQDDELAQEIRKLKFLVLDEADRMIEAGHFAELENILRLTLRELEYVRKFPLKEALSNNL